MAKEVKIEGGQSPVAVHIHTAKARASRRAPSKSQSSEVVTLERQVAVNLVELQKAYVNLAEKFDSLAKQISALLGLFEATARSFAEHPPQGEKDAELVAKINTLIEQNRLISKGLVLIEEKLSGTHIESVQEAPQAPATGEYQTSEAQPPVPATPINRPLPKF